MAKWKMNIGSVEKYNKEERKWQNGVLTIKYNSDEYFKVIISFEYLEGKTGSISADFIVNVLDEDLGKVEIDSELYIFSFEQIKKLQSKREFWDVKDIQDKDITELSPSELYLGLAKYYDNDEYCTCDIEIKKEIGCYVFIIKHYDKLCKITEKISFLSIRMNSFNIHILDASEGKVEISEEMFCFSIEQIYLLQNLHEIFLKKELSYNIVANKINESSKRYLYLGLALSYDETEDKYFDCDIAVKKENNDIIFTIKQFDQCNNIVIAKISLIIYTPNSVQFEKMNQSVCCYIGSDVLIINDTQQTMLKKFLWSGDKDD